MIKQLKLSQRDVLRYIGGFVALLATCGLGYGSYSLYKKRIEHQAQEFFSDAVKEYQKLIYSDSTDPVNPAAWQEIEAVFDKGFNRYSGSALAPFFLSYKSDILVKTNKPHEALDALRKAVSSSSKRSPFFYALKTKLALLLLDSTTESVKNEGVTMLEELGAKEFENPFFDKALYYLGYHYWMTGDTHKGAAIWADLQRKAHTSYWTDRALEKEYHRQ